MPNRIQGLDSRSVDTSSSRAVEQVRQSAAVDSDTSAPQASVDNVHITDSARQLATLAQAVKDTPDIDSARVAEAQQQIASGQYQIDAGQIADKVMQLEGDLRGAR